MWCSRLLPVNTRGEITQEEECGNAGDGAGLNGNMREVEALPVPDHYTSSANLTAKTIEKTE